MHSTVLVCLSIIALSAATLTGNRKIWLFEEGNNFVLVNQDGRTVQLFMDKIEGQKGAKSIRIQVAGPNITTKVVIFNDEQVKKTEKSEEKYQSDIMQAILKQYHGAVEMNTFEQLVDSMKKHMEMGVLNINYYYAFEFIMTPNVETIEPRNPLVKLNKPYQTQQGMMTEQTGMYGQNMPNTKYDTLMNQMPTKYDAMYHQNGMGLYNNLQDKDMYNRLLMQKYRNMNTYENDYEKDAIIRTLLEQQTEDKYNTYRRMMMGGRMAPEYTSMGQNYDSQYYMEPENLYTGRYGMDNKYGMASKYGMANKYGMNEYGMDNTYGDDMNRNTMLGKVLYKYPETHGEMQSQKYGYNTPMEYTTMKRSMYENQYPQEHQNYMSYNREHESMPYSMNLKSNNAKYTNDQMMREKMMMMMRPSMTTRKNYESQMHMNESPLMDRYTTSRKDFSTEY